MFNILSTPSANDSNRYLCRYTYRRTYVGSFALDEQNTISLKINKNCDCNL